MKTEAIRLCIQAQHGKEDYKEARRELNALLARLEELEAAEQSRQQTVLCTCETIDTQITKLLDSACPVHGAKRSF